MLSTAHSFLVFREEIGDLDVINFGGRVGFGLKSDIKNQHGVLT